MTERRPMIDMPQRCEHLPIDERGYPVPKFVETVNGAPDFRVMSVKHLSKAVKQRACWICGDKMGRHMAFVIGPMCAINRVTSEPPSHLDCAYFALKNCPFLTRPMAKRRDRDMPEGHQNPGGIMLAHNPGASCLWVTESYKPFRVNRPGAEGILFQIGEPSKVEWWTQGRHATRAEIDAAIDKGFPHLEQIARMERDAQEALRELWQYRQRMEKYLPKE